MTQEVLKLSQEALAGLKDVEKQVRELVAENKALKEALAQPERDYERGFIDGMQKQMQSSVDKAVNAMSQPEQEPVAWRVSPRYEDSDGYFDFTDSKDTADTLQKRGWTITPLYTTPPQRTEQDTIQRLIALVRTQQITIDKLEAQCGKRTANLTTIHTCTPPQENP